VAIWERLVTGPDQLVAHSLIEIEAVALIQRRIGLEALKSFQDLIFPILEVVEVSRSMRRDALETLIAGGRRDVSLVDSVSFALMRERGITRAFAFDRHFADAGFELVV
jgi:uncharacterized protein